MNIGRSIKEMRVKKGMTQKLFAKNLNINTSHLSQIEKGHKNPSLKLLTEISEYLNIPLPILFWYGVEDSDITEEKKEAFKTLKPSIDAMIGSLI